MKFRKTKQGRFILQLSESEKTVLLKILQLYPLVPEEYHRRDGSQTSGAEASRKLLEEALAEHCQSSQQRLQKFLKDSSRFTESEDGLQFTLNRSEAEWLLQVLNDVRVGSWTRLGCPHPKQESRIELNDQTAPFLWAMELSSHFEMALLHALSSQAEDGDWPLA